MRKEAIAPLLVLLMLLAAGGYIMMNDNETGSGTLDDGDGNDNTGDEWDVYYVQSGNDLPACGSSTLGRLYYVADTAGFETCTSAGWAFVDLTGPAGPAGADGSDGVNGTDGAAGADGAQGSAGPGGADGVNGTDGLDGADGASGQDGEDGSPGYDGPPGADGAAGMDGADGPSAIWLTPADLAGDTGMMSNIAEDTLSSADGAMTVLVFEYIATSSPLVAMTIPMPEGFDTAILNMTVYWMAEDTSGDVTLLLGYDGYAIGDTVGWTYKVDDTEAVSSSGTLHSTSTTVYSTTQDLVDQGDELLRIHVGRECDTAGNTGDLYILGIKIEVA